MSAASDNTSYVCTTTYSESVRNKKEWRRIENTPYEVSDQGDVRHGRRILRGGTAGAPGRKYQTVLLKNGNRQRTVYRHQIVAAAFIGPCPPGHEINHKDHNRNNNAASNLEYVTSSGNKLAAVKNGYRGTRRYNAVLDDEKVRLIRKLYADGWLVSEIARAIGVSLSCTYHVAHGETWKHVKDEMECIC